jgi:molecular chaperone HtpG
MKAMGQDVPESHPEIELNPRHALVKKLADLSQTDADLAKLVADQITNTALLRAGMLDNPADLADTSRALLERFLLDK